jgi:predicted RNA binding protein YcfA (HicA-like mRNA interferase family)
MKVKELIKKIETDGWYFARQKGSHMVFKHPVKKGHVVIPNHGLNHDVAIGTVNSVLKQAELK